MYAVIRAGGKQYRVAPGDVIRVERTPADNGTVEFGDVLAVSGQEGQIGRANDARVVGTVVEEGRGDKILVFHYKRKKQYKKLRGHRQDFTAVRITEIAFDGQSFKAPELPARQPRKAAPPAPAPEAAAVTATPSRGAKVAKAKKAGAAKKKSAAKAAKPKKSAAPKKGGRPKKK